MRGTKEAKMAMIQGQHNLNLESLGHRHDGCVHHSELGIAILLQNLDGPRQILNREVVEEQFLVRERPEKLDLRFWSQVFQQQVTHLRDHRARHNQRFIRRGNKVGDRFMILIVLIGQEKGVRPGHRTVRSGNAQRNFHDG